jgi:hypothetical protein
LRKVEFSEIVHLTPEDHRIIGVLERVLLKHPKVRAPRVQNYQSFPGTKPFSYYWAQPDEGGHDDTDSDGDARMLASHA